MDYNNIDDLWAQHNVYLNLVNNLDEIVRKINTILPFSNSATDNVRTNLTNILGTMRREFINVMSINKTRISNYYRLH